MLQKSYLNRDPAMFLKELLSAAPGEGALQVERCFRIGRDSNWRMTPKNNTDHKLIYIKGGNGYYEFEDGREGFGSGKIIFIGAGCRHCGYPGSEHSEFISLRFRTVSGLFMDYPEHFSIVSLDSTIAAGLFDEFAAAAEQELSGVSEFHLAGAILYRILCLMYNAMFRQSGSRTFCLLVKTKSCIENDPLGKHDVKDLAAVAGLNTRYFAGKFKDAFGFSPTAYVVRVKMQYAVKLLVEEGLTVKETAWRLGYADQFIFSRQFSKVYGYPPSKIKYE